MPPSIVRFHFQAKVENIPKFFVNKSHFSHKPTKFF